MWVGQCALLQVNSLTENTETSKRDGQTLDLWLQFMTLEQQSLWKCPYITYFHCNLLSAVKHILWAAICSAIPPHNIYFHSGQFIGTVESSSFLQRCLSLARQYFSM